MSALKRLGVLFISCVLIGWICGGMENVALSYILGILGGLVVWYMLFREVL